MAELVCKCGHPDSHHDAGECWTNSAGEEIWDGDDQCRCAWQEPVTTAEGEQA